MLTHTDAAPRRRCEARHPEHGWQCGDASGHPDEHTALVATEFLELRDHCGIRQSIGGNVQPYYRAYLVATDASTYEEAKARDGGNAPYMRWIQVQWREWERVTGRREPHGPDAREAFGEWLASPKDGDPNE